MKVKGKFGVLGIPGPRFGRVARGDPGSGGP